MSNSKLNSTLFSDVNRIQRCDVLKFRCEVRGYGTDVHRTFLGAYFPRWRGLYLDEARTILGEIKLFPAFPFDVYAKENGENFFTGDFVVGQSFVLGDPQNQRDIAARTFFVTSIDASQLTVFTGGSAASQSGKSTNSGAASDLLQLRDAFIERNGGVPELGLKALGRFFRDVDASGRRVVSRGALGSAAAQVGLTFSADQINGIFSSFTQDASGSIDYDELLEIIRGPMSLRRQTIVRDVFRKLDLDGDGILKLRELAARFNAGKHPHVLDGTFAADQLLKAFMLSTWDNTNHSGVVSSAEFIDYYNGVSAAIDDDSTFESVVRGSWKLV